MPRAAAPDLPTGTLTFLLTDIEGSTRLWEDHPRAMRSALARHDTLIERQVARNNGVVVRPRGEGDSRFAVFAPATDAVAAATAIQVALVRERWRIPEPLRVRMALHTGETELVRGDYYGSVVNRCARMRAIAHGGQVLLSGLTARLVRDALPDGVALRILGTVQLKDLAEGELVFQLLHPQLPADFPPLMAAEPRGPSEAQVTFEVDAGLDLPPLPAAVTSFVGREQEIAEVSRLLQTTRLLTLTGTGGIGKTRLALKVAPALRHGFPDGIGLVELASLADSSLVPQAVCAALGIQDRPPRPLEERLVDALRARSVLVILDNCEHVIQGCAELANKLLRSAPSLRILATSREPLGIAGETAWRVPSLSVPADATGPMHQALIDSEAGRLFVDRAQAALPTFSVTESTAPVIAHLCSRLDGVALAIELAAAWVPVLAVDQIDDRLDDALRLLVTGSRAAPPRQQTLRATLDWSFTLLPAVEQRFFERLAVFAGGWTLAAAEAVCADEKIQRASVLDLLAQLVKKSLVLTESAADGSVRYRLLEPVRQYALERLATSGEAELVQRRHALHCLAVAERADAALRGPDQRMWLGTLEREHDNMRAALSWSQRAGESELANALAAALSSFWAIGGHLSEGVEWLDAVQAHGGDVASVRAKVLSGSGSPQVPVRAKVLSGSGWLAMLQGDLARARRDLEASLAHARELRDTAAIAETLKHLGRLALYENDVAAAHACFSESLGLSRALGHRWSVAFDLTGLAQVAFLEHDFPRAHALFAQGLAMYRLLDSPRHVAVTLSNLARVHLEQGDFADAQAMYAEALDLVALEDDRTGLAHVLEGFSRLAEIRGDPVRAETFLGAATGIRTGYGSPLWASDHAWPDAPLSTLSTRSSGSSKSGLSTDSPAWQHGQSWSYQRALAEAINEARAPVTATSA